MSTKTKSKSRKSRRPGSGKAQRYIQPSVLLALKRGPTYGYELIQTLSQFGFMEGPAPPGMIYRHLRELEENGLVASEWNTDQSGPAKRIYHLTPEGSEVLDYWIGYMSRQAEKLRNFISMYEDIKASERP